MRVSLPYGVRDKNEEFSKDPKIRYFIACEGKKTEYKYFKGIIEFREEIGIDTLVEIIPVMHGPETGSNPLNIEKEAKEAIKVFGNFFPGDKLCIIADRDKHSFTKEQYNRLLQDENTGEITLCISNPCFEFWLLLHYSDCFEYYEKLLLENSKEGNRNYTEICLMEKLGGGYNKSNIHFKSCFRDRIKLLSVIRKTMLCHPLNLKLISVPELAFL